MSTVRRKKKNDATRLIEETIRPHFPNVEAYQFNSASIRVRVVDERFKKLSIVKRFEKVNDLIHQLPEDVQADITILLTYAPDEIATAPMNLEFEHPSPSSL